MRVYVDGSTKPSLEYRLFMAHGFGPQVCGKDYPLQKNCVDPAVSRVVDNPNAFSQNSSYPSVPTGGESSWVKSYKANHKDESRIGSIRMIKHNKRLTLLNF